MPLPDWYEHALAASVEIGRRRPFFVVGCQKSGTTWIMRLLDAHPAIRCCGEGHFTDALGVALEGTVTAYNDLGKTSRELSGRDAFCAVRLLADQVLVRALAEAPDPSRITHIGDKTPEAALAMGQLDLLYPAAMFIHVIRDGRDAAVSGWAHLERQGEGEQFGSFAEYAGYFARHHWRPYIERARNAGGQLAGRYIEVRYEQLIDDATAGTASLLRFLGVDNGPESVATCVAGGSFESASGGRRPGEEDRGSHFRKGIVGDWRNQFDDEAERRFDDEAGELLDSLGYTDKHPCEAVDQIGRGAREASVGPQGRTERSR
jgi:hypothetical protein